MLFKFPIDDAQYKWTRHIKDKMLYYGISPQKIKTILKSHDRHEEGVAENTHAVMKRNDTSKRKEEVWVMYANELKGRGRMLKVFISTWRYPGISKPGKKIPIPDEILAEIKEKWFSKGSS